MALGDERRASGRAMEANRRAIDGAMRAARQSTFKRDLNALESGSTARRSGALRSVESRGGVPSSTARVDYTPPPSTGVGGGIASPVTETSFASREFWPDRFLQTSDGVFVIQLQPPKKIVMADANSAEVVLQFASPT